jgi:toxin YoeB
MPPAIPYEAVFDPAFREDLAYWAATDRKILRRALALVEAILSEPCEGAGKPIPLKVLPATWSRRLTAEDRVVYRITENRVYFLQTRYHHGH